MFKNKLTDREKEYNILKKIENNFKREFNLTPCLGAELEFYLINLTDTWQLTKLEENIEQKIKKEKGYNQYEVEIPPSTNTAFYPDIINKMKRTIKEEARKLNLEANFKSKPFTNDYGSSMHIHLNFLEDNDAEQYARILCHYLPLTITAFLPKEEDYQRLDSRFMAPTHICYGGNNRTTLIRIPDSLPKRIEHRLASADANPYEVIYAILSSIYSGLKHPQQITKIDKIYGNAYDPQYNLLKILRSN